jgi:hypothetical protein
MTNSTFTNCTIETNPDGIGNGISIVENGVPQSTLSNDTFKGLLIKTQPRMGFEMLSRTFYGAKTITYSNIEILDSTIEPVGAESISFEDGTGQLIEGNHFEGSSASTVYPWHQTLEFNGSVDAVAKNNTFDLATGAWLNLHCTSCDFEDNTFDSRIVNVDQPGASDTWEGVTNDSTFKDNTVIINTGGGFMGFATSSGNTFTGNTFWDTRNPTDQRMYFTDDSTDNTFSDNIFKNYYAYNPAGDYAPGISIDATSSVTFTGNTYESP